MFFTVLIGKKKNLPAHAVPSPPKVREERESLKGTWAGLPAARCYSLLTPDQAEMAERETRSKVWLYFTKVDGDNARCQKCLEKLRVQRWQHESFVKAPRYSASLEHGAMHCF